MGSETQIKDNGSVYFERRRHTSTSSSGIAPAMALLWVSFMDKLNDWKLLLTSTRHIGSTNIADNNYNSDHVDGNTPTLVEEGTNNADSVQFEADTAFIVGLVFAILVLMFSIYIMQRIYRSI